MSVLVVYLFIIVFTVLILTYITYRISYLLSLDLSPKTLLLCGGFAFVLGLLAPRVVAAGSSVTMWLLLLLSLLTVSSYLLFKSADVVTEEADTDTLWQEETIQVSTDDAECRQPDDRFAAAVSEAQDATMMTAESNDISYATCSSNDETIEANPDDTPVMQEISCVEEESQKSVSCDCEELSGQDDTIYHAYQGTCDESPADTPCEIVVVENDRRIEELNETSDHENEADLSEDESSFAECKRWEEPIEDTPEKTIALETDTRIEETSQLSDDTHDDELSQQADNNIAEVRQVPCANNDAPSSQAVEIYLTDASVSVDAGTDIDSSDATTITEDEGLLQTGICSEAETGENRLVEEPLGAMYAGNFDHYLDLGFTAREDHDYSAAISAFQKAIAVDPENPSVLYIITEICALLKLQGYYDQAILQMQKGRDLALALQDHAMARQFVDGIAYLRILKNILIANRIQFSPFSTLPEEIILTVDEEFRQWQTQ